ncbi:carboxypeptidase regulatory-like domain-containing protein, partial [Bacteroidota bacterium]
ITIFFLTFLFIGVFSQNVLAQGVTTSAMFGVVADADGEPLPGANVIAVHVPSGTQYGASTRTNGLFNLPNLRIGGPYTVTVSYVGFHEQKQAEIFLMLNQNLKLEFSLESESVELGEVVISAEQDEVLNSARTGAATYIDPNQVQAMPSIKRSTRDLTRMDPRSDGNFSFAGRNWLLNNISLDGSYFNNPFGLDDPAPGGQTNAEPVPFDAIEQVQVSVAPFDIREGGFTGAGINTVTKSGTNVFKGSLYSFIRNEAFVGDKIGGAEILVPDLTYNQSGFTVSGPIIPNKLFVFISGEIERREDPGSGAFIADTDNNPNNNAPGVSRVSTDSLTLIRNRMITEYGYDPGSWQGYTHDTKNNKLLVKLDWNVNDNNNLTLRYNMLDAEFQKPPHPIAISYNSTLRGPNSNALPFENAGYQINNELNSFAMELNSRYEKFSNRLFVSYNRFRDFRNPASEPFPTIEIGSNGLTYTTLGHEPFSIHNILDQDVLQITNNFSYYLGKHVITAGVTFEYFDFFNSFNLFRYGFMGFNTWPGQTAFNSVKHFLDATDPANPNQVDFDYFATPETVPFKGEFIEVGQLAFYAQDEYLVSDQFSLTYGLRVDIPMYITDPVDNPFSRGLTLLDENDGDETIDQSKLPDATPLFSPRIGFNWDVTGDRSTQLRGGVGLFTGRLPFVWIGNVISNPGANPNLYPFVNPSISDPRDIDFDDIIETKDNSVLMQSGDLNAMVDDFKWPQTVTVDLAVDKKLPWDLLGTLEFMYTKDINSIYIRNANVGKPIATLNDGRPYFGGSLADASTGNVFVMDNTNEGHSFNITAQLRKKFASGLNTFLSYRYLEAKNMMTTAEIAFDLYIKNPVQGDPNKPELSYSEFGQRHRIVAGANYRHVWNENLATTFGVFFEAAEGNLFTTTGGNRYSFIYAGDVNGDGVTGNDLIYIPGNQNEINFADITDDNGNVTVTANEQWDALNDFIEQDDYLSENRGSIAEKNGLVNPWYFNIDLRILQDFSLLFGGKQHTFQLSLDILNVPNLLNSDWGVRKVADGRATSPLKVVGQEADNEPILNFDTSITETFIDDPSIFSRWQMQV